MASPNFPGATSFNIGATQTPPASNADVAERFEDWLSATKRLVGASVEQVYTMAGGGIFPNGQSAMMLVDTQGGVSSGDLHIISPAAFHPGAMICIRNVDDSRHVIVKHMNGVGAPIFLHGAADLPLRSSSQRLFLQLNGSKTQWLEVSRYYGTNHLDARGRIGLAAGAVWGECTAAEAQGGTNGTSIVTPRRVTDALHSANLIIGNKTYRNGYAGNNAHFLYIDWTNGFLWRVSAQELVGKEVGDLRGASFTKVHYSGDQVVTTGAGGSWNHGLGGTPTDVSAYLICRTAEHGYSVGDLIVWNDSYGSEDTRTIMIGFNSTQVFYRVVNDVNPLASKLNKSTGATVTLTQNNWRLIINARR